MSLRSLIVAVALAAGSLSPILTATPAQAAATVTVTNEQGTSQADSRYATKLTVRGSGFQSVKGGFGGVYLMFGWVSSGWRPSQGGVTGDDYRYIPDSESGNNHGYMKFIAFEGSSTQREAHAVLSASGSFSLSLTVPGPTFNSVDRNGKTTTVDCLKVTCGVITIGAHGVKNPRNETFTPVEFGNIFDSAPPEQKAPADTDEQAAPGAPQPGQQATVPQASLPRRVGKPVVRTDRASAQVGRALTFTGKGFLPGEQVLAVLDDGLAAMGPMVAGNNGEIAGVLQLPSDLPAGTHELRLSGAGSGVKATERFAVRAADAAPAAAETGADEDRDTGLAPSRLFLVIAIGVFAVTAIGFGIRWLLLRRSARRPAPVPVAQTWGGD